MMHVRRRLWRLNQRFLHIEAAIPPIQLEEKKLYSLIGEYGTGKTTSAVERTLQLAKASPRNSSHARSVLALYALADKKSSFARSLNKKIDFYSLERNGHTVSNIFSFCRQMLQEFGLDKVHLLCVIQRFYPSNCSLASASLTQTRCTLY